MSSVIGRRVRWVAALAWVGLGCASSPPPLPLNAAVGRRGMVATVNPLATDAGVAALARGGNAVDAAVAAAVTLGVVDGQNSGLGGGCFILIRCADGSIFAIDGREMAPAAASRDMFLRGGKADPELSQTGALAVGVPGSVAAYERALRVAGRGTLAEALNPAADIAERGFAINRSFALRLAATSGKIAKFPESARILLHADGTPLREGETLIQPELAQTYRAIAKGGSDYFYKGPFAKAVGEWMRANGGLVTVDDFAAYQLKMRKPIVTTYRGYTVIGFPPPSSGGAHVAQILNILENFDVGKLPETTRVHVTAEAMKLAFADRAHFLGDPDFVPVPTGLTDKAYAKELASRISLTSTLAVPTHGSPPGDEAFGDYSTGKHTTHVAAADSEGNWVAITTTVNTSFGSKVIVPGTGVILNDQMDDFSAKPGAPNAFKLVGNENNAIAPRKRPLSSMSPTIVLDARGKPFMTVGAAGGPTIITQVALVMSNEIDLHDALPAALRRPRYHHQWSPDQLRIEDSFSRETLDGLRALGHPLEVIRPVGATQAIMRLPDGSLLGVSEPRLQGKAAGR